MKTKACALLRVTNVNQIIKVGYDERKRYQKSGSQAFGLQDL